MNKNDLKVKNKKKLKKPFKPMKKITGYTENTNCGSKCHC